MRQALDIYDDYPTEMKRYLRNYGWHFNKKACDYAVSLMKKKDPSTGKLIATKPLAKEKIDELLSINGINLENNNGYDYVYVANMCKADYYGSSITDDAHLALYIKDTIDDPDAGDGVVMRKWYASIVACGEVVDWEDFL